MKIGVYGLGRFGSFWAGAIAKNTPESEVVAYSRNEHPLPEGVKRVSEDEVLSADMIFFCVAISSFEAVLERVSGRIKKGAIVMDTCSVKTYPAKWMQKYLKDDDVYLVATHPMFGPDSAKNGVKDLPLVLCPIEGENEAFIKVKELFSSWHLRVIVMSPTEHDLQAAYSQGVTHFVGRTLKKLGIESTLIGTKGFNSLLQIMEQTCNDPMQLFYDLQRYNPYTRKMRKELSNAFSYVDGQVEAVEEPEFE